MQAELVWNIGDDAPVKSGNPDLVILDIGLPGMDGLEVTKAIREWSEVPILILSVQDQERQKIAALDSGAADYLTKPFGVGELMARISVAIRHANKLENDPLFEIADLSLDFLARGVTMRGEAVALTPTEYDLLSVLVHSAGKVLTHRQIMLTVWGEGYEQDSHLLRVNISNLRKKLELDPSRPEYIITEAGVGYRFRQPD